MKVEEANKSAEPVNSNNLVWMVIGVATILRLYGLTAFSLSNDELSALARLQFDSVEQVIRDGVYPDFHPAGVQVFLYYWTQFFGFGEWIVRLPFALMGIGSVYFLFRTGKYWFGFATGLFAAAALAVLEYPLVYSQIARPYSPGLFFSLLATFFWTRLLFHNSKISKRSLWLNAACFALSVSACMYIHYFSFIFAGILCASGLFFLNRKSVWPYILSGVIIVLLYLPHFNIFIHQLSKGGVGGAEGWLGPPGTNAFAKYLDYCFNDSYQLKILFAVIVFGTIVLFRKEIRLHRFHLLSLLFFIIPFAIAYFYSLWGNPVFQHSVLLFSFPFLLLLLFSFVPSNPGNFTTRILLSAIIIGGAYSTVYEKKYYTTAHFTEFRGIANRIKSLDDQLGTDKITKTISVFSPYYIQYYLDKMDHKTAFALTSVMSVDERREFRNVVEQSETPYFLHAFSNVYDDPQFDMIIRSKYPWVLERDSMLNSGLRLYSREQNDTALNRLPVFKFQYGFEKGSWQNENSFTDTLMHYEGLRSVHMKPGDEYGPGYIKKLSEAALTPGSVVELNQVVWSDKPFTGAKLVFTIERDKKALIWNAVSFSENSGKPGSWYRVFLSVTIPEGLDGSEELKIYTWNEKHEDFRFDDFNMSVYSSR